MQAPSPLQRSRYAAHLARRVGKVVSRASIVLLVASGMSACHHAKLAVVVEPRPQRGLLHDVTVLDVESGDRQANRDVLIDGTQIRAIVDSGAWPVVGDTLEIDGAGATLLPGLIDMHAHTGISPAPVSVGAWPDPAANLAAYL